MSTDIMPRVFILAVCAAAAIGWWLGKRGENEDNEAIFRELNDNVDALQAEFNVRKA